MRNAHILSRKSQPFSPPKKGVRNAGESHTFSDHFIETKMPDEKTRKRFSNTTLTHSP